MRAVWPVALAGSLAVHGALLAAATVVWQAQPLPPQARPEARLTIASQDVAASTAQAQAAQGTATTAAATAGDSLPGADIPQTTARASRPNAAAARPVALPPATKAQVATPPATPLTAALPAPVATPPAAPDAPAATAIAPPPAAPLVRPTAPEAAALRPPAPPAAALPPPAQRGTASLAWTGADGPLDPVSLTAIAAFMQPGDLASASAARLRDGIGATLDVPCARLQTAFDPETGAIELRGHLPDEALRAPVLAALQAQVGARIPVTDRLRLLPRPQCQALAAIAAVGLAQSTEQDTNPRVVGADTFVRDYALTAGQRLVFDMTAPDYPAVIYVDYFDAAGNVLHMQPNDQVPATLAAPKSALAVGQDAPGVPALQLVVGPPFGQEIAVAFAASAPLYAGVRPTVEPAGPYLAFLQTAVAQARARDPGFKGEWVYFFVTTRP